MLFWNRLNQEFTSTFLGKTPLTHQTRRTFNRSRAIWNGPIRNTFNFFLLKPIRDNLAPGFPRALHHARESTEVVRKTTLLKSVTGMNRSFRYST